jgi:hypothetical protein
MVTYPQPDALLFPWKQQVKTSHRNSGLPSCAHRPALVGKIRREGEGFMVALGDFK